MSGLWGKSNKATGGKESEHKRAKQRKEADTHELGSRAARGLFNENIRPWGMDNARGTINGRGKRGARE